MIPIFITITTCGLDIEELDTSLSSFHKNLLNCKWEQVIINVDKYPDTQPIIAITNTIFPYCGSVQRNYNPEPCFPAAVKWVWMALPPDALVCHMEGDWVLSSPVDLLDIQTLLTEPNKVIQLQYHSHNRISLSPFFANSNTLKALAEEMTDKEDPEKQVRELWRGETIIYPPRTNPRVVYGEYYATTPIVKDIGRDNLKRRKYQKNKDQSGYFIKYKDK